MGNLDYIDDFFSGKPAPEQIKQFERRLSDDTGFAEDVAFYLNLRQVAGEQVLEEKKQRFGRIFRLAEPDVKGRMIRNTWSYIAAAAVMAAVIIGAYFFMREPASAKLADRYMRTHFQSLGVSMGAVPNDIETGIRLANDNKLEDALRQFEAILRSDGADVNAKKFAGIVSLRLGRYDKALAYFKQLATHTELYANPGIFYEALTLLKRNAAGDKKQARILLQQVVASELEGKETAKEWLEAL